MAKQWTVEEVVEYERTHKPKEQVYGKYGTIAKHYLEQHQGIEMTMIGHIPDYLHGIDRQANESTTLCTNSCLNVPNTKRRAITLPTFASKRKCKTLSNTKYLLT